ncbi:MAG: selenocysteine-specific translation elongation factor, partial [Candidatus Zixiibacteriota bacterium]
MFVIGTAGHIDHGKSAIINRLTGIDPDRLPEEKERGMTIDIGFAHYDTPDGRRIGIIDVPGHERFVRNMIAGAGGIDAVILVVAADDGWMPQSQEHLQITKLLGIKYGLIAINKIDLVETSWLDLVEDDIREKVAGSFLQDAPVVRLSAVTGDGFDVLRGEILKLADRIIKREDIAKPRLYIDRSFILSGMGGVVAGTLRGGMLKIGDEIGVFPARKIGKVRTIQSHGRQIETAEPGQRTSISLTGIDKEYLHRGGVISTPHIIADYPEGNVFAVSTSVIPESPVSLDSGRRLLMIIGTTEVEGEIRMASTPIIHPGQQGFLFFRPDEPVMAFVGDRCIFRLPTPQSTVGGGVILDHLDRFPRRREIPQFQYLKDRDELTQYNLVYSELKKSIFINKNTDFVFSNYSQSEIDQAVDDLMDRRRIDEHDGRHYLISEIAPGIELVLNAVKEIFETHPHYDGIGIEMIAARTGRKAQSLEPILDLMCGKKQLIKKKNKYNLPGRSIDVRGDVKQAAQIIEIELYKGGYAPPTAKELIGKDSVRREALEFLINTEKAVRT